jgi:hypothetical protein
MVSIFEEIWPQNLCEAFGSQILPHIFVHRSGCFVFAYWMIANVPQNAPPPSIGFPAYIYPDNIGDGGVCDMYNGVPCENDPSLCCYNTDLWCPTNGTECTADNGAYPIGDQPVFANQLTDYLALSVRQSVVTVPFSQV